MSTDHRADTARPAASTTPAAPSRFDIWILTRPLIGGILVVLAGVEMFFSTQLDLGNLHIQVGIEGMQATILPITLVVLGVLAIVSPSQRLFYGILTLVVAIYSLVAVNLGGFLVGMLLGVAGGIVVVTWAPQREGDVLGGAGAGAGAAGGVAEAGDDRAGVPERALEAGVTVDAGAGPASEVEQASDDRTIKANADRSADVGMRRDRVRPGRAASADDLAHSDDLAVVTGALSSAPEPPPFSAAPADTGAATPGTIPAPLPARAGPLTLTLLAAVIVSSILTSGLAAPSARADDVGGCSGSSCDATPTPDPGAPGEPVPGSTPTSTPGPTPSVPTPSVPTTATPTSTPTSSPTPPTSGPDDGTTHGSAGGSGGSARGDTDPAAAAATAAATPAPPVIADALYPGATAQVSGSSLGLTGGRFVGVTTATLLDGRTVPVLRIAADQMSIADFSLDAPAAGGRRQPNTASRMSADGRVELLVVSVGGTLADGTGIRFDAAAPPPDGTLLPGLTGPVVELVSITGDSLRLVGSHQQVPDA